MTLSAGLRGRHLWIAAVAAIVLGSQHVSVSATVLDARIAIAKDDAEEHAAGNINLASSDLELVEDGGPQTVGMRWELAIPQGVTITAAWIQFTCKEVRTEVTSLEIAAQAADDAAAFDTTAGSISSRPRTTIDVDWTPGPWALGEAAANERTPGLQALVQAIVSRPGWRPGQALVILITGSGRRTAWAFDGNAAAAPLLHVEFDGGPPPPPPIDPIALHVGYYDTHHPDRTRPKPDPWKGSPGVVFVGTADAGDGGWDSSCVRIDNLTAADITNVVVTVDIGEDHFALWGTRSIPAHGTLILAQTGFENFDGSDSNEAGCPGCDPTWCMTKVNSTIPLITVRIGGVATHYLDRDQVLNTRGVDSAGCPYTGGRNDESQQWVEVPPEDAVLAVGGVSPGSYSLPLPTAVALAAPVPNPTRRSVMFRFRMPVSGPVQLGIYDAAGRLALTCVDTELEAGEYLRGLDVSDLRPGVYFGVLRAPGGVARTSVVVAR